MTDSYPLPFVPLSSTYPRNMEKSGLQNIHDTNNSNLLKNINTNANKNTNTGYNLLYTNTSCTNMNHNNGNNIVNMPSLITYYLENLLYSNAIFLAERLYAEYCTEENRYLLAKCYIKCGLHRKAMSLLESSNSSRNRYLYAYCCFHLGKLGEAETALLAGTPIKEKGPTECREYILKNICNSNNNTSTKEEKAINDEESSSLNSNSCIPNGAAGIFLLGRICQRAYRRQHAIEYFKLALEVDPYMWCAFEALCKVDMNVNSEHYYGPPTCITSLHGAQMRDISSSEDYKENNENIMMNNNNQDQQFFDFTTPGTGTQFNPKDSNFLRTPYDNSPLQVGGKDNKRSNFNLTNNKANANDSTNSSSFLVQTPSKKGPNQLQDNNHVINSNFNQGMIRNQGDPGDKNHLGSSNLMTPNYINNNQLLGGRQEQQGGKGPAAFNTPGLSPIPPSDENNSNMGKNHPTLKDLKDNSFSRGRKLQSSSLTSTSTRNKGKLNSSQNVVSNSTGKGVINQLQDQADNNNIAQNIHGNNNNDLTLQKTRLTFVENPNTTLMNLLPLLATLGKAFELLCKYNCKECIYLLQKNLPPTQYNTGWVQMCIGKAYFEMANYVEARATLEHMLVVDPQRNSGLDLLSTSLWQLRDDVALAFLAQQVHDRERSTKEGWCVIGNCFSLQKEHETALKFFQRALVLDPYYTYAYTLCGHEYIANENFDKALACFRFAVRIDPYHYNAWYGLGHIYYRQEKYDMAEYHFSRALGINSHNAVLHCSLGMSLHASHRSEEALDRLQTASLLDPKNHVARFNRASVLVSLERHHEALQELEKLRNVVPKEAAIYSLLGKIYKKIGDRRKAIHNFTIAMDLSPKDNNKVKSAMDHLDDSDVEEEKL